MLKISSIGVIMYLNKQSSTKLPWVFPFQHGTWDARLVPGPGKAQARAMKNVRVLSGGVTSWVVWLLEFREKRKRQSVLFTHEQCWISQHSANNLNKRSRMAFIEWKVASFLLYSFPTLRISFVDVMIYFDLFPFSCLIAYE